MILNNYELLFLDLPGLLTNWYFITVIGDISDCKISLKAAENHNSSKFD
jgi:hypothetical protein